VSPNARKLEFNHGFRAASAARRTEHEQSETALIGGCAARESYIAP